MAPAYLNVNLNIDHGLINGTLVREHSLAFESKDLETYINDMKNNTPIGNTIDLPSPPDAINVELYPDFIGDNQCKIEENIKKRKSWLLGSITNDGHIIIPISINNKIKYDGEQNPYVPVVASSNSGLPKCPWLITSLLSLDFASQCQRLRYALFFRILSYFSLHFSSSQKSQLHKGRTTRKVIASLSEHPTPF